jgi:hypothetical protein
LGFSPTGAKALCGASLSRRLLLHILLYNMLYSNYYKVHYKAHYEAQPNYFIGFLISPKPGVAVMAFGVIIIPSRSSSIITALAKARFDG